MTGFAILAAELNVKRIELLREVLPQASRIGVLHERRQRRILAPIEEGARKLGFQVIRLEARGAADMEEIFATAMKERVGGVMPVASALFHAEKQRLVDLSTRHRLPAIYESRAFTEVGGLMSYGPDMVDVFRRVGAYVHRILTGTRPADLPVEQPTTFELVINQKTASALGLTIPRSLLLQATNVIE
jgi:putative ABC transport system substrate-binding protein